MLYHIVMIILTLTLLITSPVNITSDVIVVILTLMLLYHPVLKYSTVQPLLLSDHTKRLSFWLDDNQIFVK